MATRMREMAGEANVTETLLDLARACRAMGDGAAAASAYRQVAANWKRADSTIAAVQEARARAK